jgi:hypothetical protein
MSWMVDDGRRARGDVICIEGKAVTDIWKQLRAGRDDVMNGSAENGTRPRPSRKSGSGSASRRSVAGTLSVVPYRLDTHERAKDREECPRQCLEVVCWLARRACGRGVSG